MSRRSDTTTKVFVGSLPPDVSAEDLRGLFSPYGSIAECDIANRCGFLHLEDKDLADKAIEELNNTTFMGGRISVEKGRVKPPRGDRRGGPMRNPRGGGGPGGRKPYSRDGGGFGGGGGRGGPRNGGFGGRGDYGDFDGGYPPRDFGGYDDGFDRRPPPPMFDDRRGGGYGDRRPPFNGGGYERRRPMYGDDMPPYPEPPRGGGYEDRRMPPSGGGFEDRRPPMGERRPLIPEGGMAAGGGRPPMNYDRAPPSGDNMFSRRDMPPKAGGGGGGYDRQASKFGGATTALNAYNPPPSVGGYGDNRGAPQPPPPLSAIGGGYGMVRPSGAAPVSSGGFNSGGHISGYTSIQSGGGYGDSYGVGARTTNTYDSAYPPLPRQGGFAGGNAQGPRDMPPARRY